MRTETDSPEQDRPVFVLAQHRSGGTLLTRLLNCHPGLVIWGEHAGFLNKLAEAQDMLDRHAGLLPQRSPAELRHYASGRPDGDGFLPWTVPFGGAAFLAGCRAMVRGLFALDLRPGQRWGFKEIRYHSPTVVRFLRRLFPGAQFILLDRDPIELCVSDMLVSWALGSLMAERVQHDRQAFLAAVDDCLYAILAVRQNLTHARAAIADQSIAVRYEALVSAPEAEMAGILGFCGCRTAPGYPLACAWWPERSPARPIRHRFFRPAILGCSPRTASARLRSACFPGLPPESPVTA